MAKRVNFWELPVEAAQPDDTLVAYRGRGKVSRIKVDDVQGSGTVTSVGLSMPAGFSVANAPVTSSGTITVTFASGYGLPTTTQMGQWSTAFGWGDHAQAGYALASSVTSALAGKVDTSDSRLTNSREWDADTVGQVEAESGTSTTRRAWTAQRVRQSVIAWWGSITGAFGRTLVGAAIAADARDALELGTAALRNVPTSGNAAIGQAVLGNDTRLTNARAPTAHTHQISDITGLQSELNTKAPINSPEFTGLPTAERVYLSMAAPANPNDSNAWPNGVSMVQHITEGWAPEDYIGVLHATINVNRAFQLTVGANGFYVRRLHSSETNAQWQAVWTDRNFNPAAKVDSTDPRLSNPREWIAATISQGDAEAGASVARTAWTSQRVRQNVAAYTYSSSQIDALIAAATSGAWIWQATTTTLPKNTPSKVDFSSPRTLTLPASPAENDYVAILRTAGTTVGSTIARNGQTIMGVAEDMTLDVNVSYLRLDFVNSSWRIAS